jgi:L-aminopeptidase/D-esterase-like protein
MALGVDGTKVGTWTHDSGTTGCTVVVPPAGSVGAMAVRGGAPGTREAAALGPTGRVTECHAVVLSGGSAFGLATADGVVAWCEEQGIGFQTATARVPIVGAAIVFDLRSQDAPRPGRDAGRQACTAATEDDPPMGRVGAGAGCTVGKSAGIEWHAPGGQGWAVTRAGGVTVGALMIVNAIGDVIDEHGRVLAGSRAPADVPRFPEALPPGPADTAPQGPGALEHTVIGCVVTDATLDKPSAHRVADLAHTGVARSVEPAHTSYDGDAMFVLCAGRVPATLDLVSDLAARSVAAAVRNAVRPATPQD